MYKLLILFLSFSFPLLAVSFLPGSEDIPLMPGMTTSDTPVRFDKISGQVLSMTVNTREEGSRVFQFYDETLANLGWAKTENGLYTRGSETLMITLSPQKNNLNSVRFELSESHTN